MNTTRFNQLVDDCADALYRFAAGIVHNTETARDITQESFTRLWENRQKVTTESARAYLFTIAYRLSVSHYRTTKKHSYNNLDHFSTTSLIHHNAVYDNTAELLWRELDRLPSMHRTLIMLCDWEGYSYREIAEITGLNEGQVKIGLFRARQTVKNNFNDIYNEN